MNMMKRYKTPINRTYHGVVLKIKKSDLYQHITVYTKEEGLLHIVHRRGKKILGNHTILPLGSLIFNIQKEEQILFLSEFECTNTKATLNLSLDYFIYSQIFIEMILSLIPPGVTDHQIYQLLCTYTQTILKKDPRIVTIIAGWQLVGYAGYYPDVNYIQIGILGKKKNRILYYLGDNLPINVLPHKLMPSVRTLWKTLLQYNWNTTAVLQINKTDIVILENLLYSYIEQCSEKELKSINARYELGE